MGIYKKIKRNKLLAENISYLALFQIANYILPIIVFPYLIRIIGIDKFGIVSLAQAAALYLNVLIDYGFNFSATKFISTNRENFKLVNKTISSVLTIKLLIFLVVFVFFIPIIYYVDFLNINFFLYLTGYMILFGIAIFPIWFFQGIEKLKHITYANLIGKIITITLIFILIKEEHDYIYILLIYAIGSLITGIIGLFFIKFYGFSFGKISIKDIKFHLSEGYSIFVASIGINLYRNMNILLVGLFTSHSVTGIYSVAEKLLKSIQMMISPITQAIFPNASKKISEISKREGKKYIANLKKNIFVILLIIYSLSLILSPVASLFFFKEYDTLFFIIFLILSPVIIFGGLNYMLGIVGLINFGLYKSFKRSIFVGAFVNLFVGLIGGYFIGVYGVSLALLAAEISVFLMLNKYFKNI